MQIKTKKLKDIAFNLLDPMIRRRTGLSLDVIENWSLVVGSDVSLLCTPLKLIWPQTALGSSGSSPATLLIACQGGVAVQIMHQNLQIIERINSFFGYYAVDKIKITQQAVNSGFAANAVAASVKKPAVVRSLSGEEEEYIYDLVKNIQDESLKASLLKIGRSIYKDVIEKR